MIQSLRKSELISERWGPAAIGGVSALVAWAYAPTFFRVAAERAWSYDVVYSATFDVATVITAFLFAFYTFVLTQESGFIGRMKRTIAYKGLLRFTTGAMWLGVAVVVVTIPMMIVAPKPVSLGDPSLIAVSAWAGLASWSIAAFLRAAIVFGIFAHPER